MLVQAFEKVEGARREGFVLAEAVDDAPDVARLLALEDRERVLGRLARVHDDRLAELARKADEPREDVEPTGRAFGVGCAAQGFRQRQPFR